MPYIISNSISTSLNTHTDTPCRWKCGICSLSLLHNFLARCHHTFGQKSTFKVIILNCTNIRNVLWNVFPKVLLCSWLRTMTFFSLIWWAFVAILGLPSRFGRTTSPSTDVSLSSVHYQIITFRTNE